MSTCIITGASSGIGRSASVAISKKKIFDNIILIGRREVELQQTKCLMDLKNTNVVIKVFDVYNINDIPEMVEDCYYRFGSIDCLLNIAGYTDPKFIFETDNNNIQKTFTINVFAPYIFCRECAKYMKKNEGISKIINIASTAGCSPRPGWSTYAMSKAAIIEMSLTLSEELGAYKIKVYCLSPGRCATALRKLLAPEEDQTKIMQPEVVGEEICRMASQNETCLDGQNIIIRKKF